MSNSFNRLEGDSLIQTPMRRTARRSPTTTGFNRLEGDSLIQTAHRPEADQAEVYEGFNRLEGDSLIQTKAEAGLPLSCAASSFQSP